MTLLAGLPAFARSWGQLSPEEKAAAESVGFTEQHWDADSDDEESFHTVRWRWWDDLSTDVQSALKSLGHQRQTWDSNLSDEAILPESSWEAYTAVPVALDQVPAVVATDAGRTQTLVDSASSKASGCVQVSESNLLLPSHAGPRRILGSAAGAQGNATLESEEKPKRVRKSLKPRSRHGTELDAAGRRSLHGRAPQDGRGQPLEPVEEEPADGDFLEEEAEVATEGVAQAALEPVREDREATASRDEKASSAATAEEADCKEEKLPASASAEEVAQAALEPLREDREAAASRDEKASPAATAEEVAHEKASPAATAEEKLPAAPEPLTDDREGTASRDEMASPAATAEEADSKEEKLPASTSAEDFAQAALEPAREDTEGTTNGDEEASPAATAEDVAQAALETAEPAREDREVTGSRDEKASPAATTEDMAPTAAEQVQEGDGLSDSREEKLPASTPAEEKADGKEEQLPASTTAEDTAQTSPEPTQEDAEEEKLPASTTAEDTLQTSSEPTQEDVEDEKLPASTTAEACTPEPVDEHANMLDSQEEKLPACTTAEDKAQTTPEPAQEDANNREEKQPAEEVAATTPQPVEELAAMLDSQEELLPASTTAEEHPEALLSKEDRLPVSTSAEDVAQITPEPAQEDASSRAETLPACTTAEDTAQAAPEPAQEDADSSEEKLPGSTTADEVQPEPTQEDAAVSGSRAAPTKVEEDQEGLGSSQEKQLRAAAEEDNIAQPPKFCEVACQTSGPYTEEATCLPHLASRTSCEPASVDPQLSLITRLLARLALPAGDPLLLEAQALLGQAAKVEPRRILGGVAAQSDARARPNKARAPKLKDASAPQVESPTSDERFTPAEIVPDNSVSKEQPLSSEVAPQEEGDGAEDHKETEAEEVVSVDSDGNPLEVPLDQVREDTSPSPAAAVCAAADPDLTTGKQSAGLSEEEEEAIPVPTTPDTEKQPEAGQQEIAPASAAAVGVFTTAKQDAGQQEEETPKEAATEAPTTAPAPAQKQDARLQEEAAPAAPTAAPAPVQKQDAALQEVTPEEATPAAPTAAPAPTQKQDAALQEEPPEEEASTATAAAPTSAKPEVGEHEQQETARAAATAAAVLTTTEQEEAPVDTTPALTTIEPEGEEPEEVAPVDSTAALTTIKPEEEESEETTSRSGWLQREHERHMVWEEGEYVEEVVCDAPPAPLDAPVASQGAAAATAPVSTPNQQIPVPEDATGPVQGEAAATQAVGTPDQQTPVQDFPGGAQGAAGATAAEGTPNQQTPPEAPEVAAEAAEAAAGAAVGASNQQPPIQAPEVAAEAAEAAAAAGAPNQQPPVQARAPAARKARPRIQLQEPVGNEKRLQQDLRTAREKVSALYGVGKEEAAASLAAAQLAFSLADLPGALELANRAMSIYAEENDYPGAAGQAEASCLVVKCQLAQDEIEEAGKLTEQLLAAFRTQGNRRAEALARLSSSEALLAADRTKQALVAAEAALTVFRELGDEPWVAAALQAVARAYLRFDKASCTRTAFEKLAEAAEVLQQVGDEKEMAAVLLAMCKVRSDLQMHEEAKSLAMDSLEISRRLGDQRSVAAAMREAASVLCAAQSELQRGLDYGANAVVLLGELGDVAGEVTARQVLANLWQSCGKPDEALNMLDEALSLARERQDYQQIGVILNTVIAIHGAAGDVDKAMSAAKDEADLAASSGNQLRELASLKRLARLQMAPEINQPACALDYLDQAAKRAAGNKQQVAAVLHFKAEVLQAHGEVQEALRACSTAEVLLKSNSQTKVYATALQLKADLYWQVGDAASARKTYSDQRVLYQVAGWQDKEAQALLNLAAISWRMERTKEAQRFAREAVELQRSLQDEDGEAYALLALAGYQGPTTEAAKTVDSACTVFKKVGDVVGEAQALQISADIFLQNGNMEQALDKCEEALVLVTQAEELRAQADVLQTLASVHARNLERLSAVGSPINKELAEALKAVARLEKACQDAGDLLGRVNALNQASAWHVLNKDPTSAVAAADQAVEGADQLGAADVVALSFLSLAEACLAAENGPRAKEAAENAFNTFETLGDEGACQEARRLAEAATELARRPKAATQQKVETKPEPVHSSKETTNQPPVPEPQPMEERQVEPPRPPRGQRKKAFSNFVDEDASRGGNRAEERGVQSIDDPASQDPPQELRRRQLLRAGAAKPRTGFQDFKSSAKKAEVTPPEHVLRTVLSAACPHFSEKDLDKSEEKLKAVDITTTKALYEQLKKKNGLAELQDKWRAKEFPVMKTDTLRTLRTYCSTLEGIA